MAELTEKLKYYLNTNTSDYVKKIKELQQLNDKQKTELNELKTKINNTNLSKNDSLSVVNPGEKIIAIKFECPGNNINFPMACKNTDIYNKNINNN